MCCFQLTSWKHKTQYQVKISSEEMFEKKKEIQLKALDVAGLEY